MAYHLEVAFDELLWYEDCIDVVKIIIQAKIFKWPSLIGMPWDNIAHTLRVIA